jgi:hypothetical protein
MGYSRTRPNHIPRIFEGDADVELIGGELNMVESDHDEIPILTNAMHRWSGPKQEFLGPWEYDTQRVLDSGGYNVQADYSDHNGDIYDNVSQSDIEEQLEQDAPFYPWTVEQYHGWLFENRQQFEWAAVMDYACEERFDRLWSVEDRIDATIENTIRQFDLHGGEYDLLPVLQGRSLDDYIECYDRLEAAGVPVRKCGLGTVCRLSSSEKIVELEKSLREAREFDYIHGFGVKVDSFSRGATFESADSQAWVWDASHGKESIYNGSGIMTRECDDSLRRTVVSFREYYRHVYALRNGEDPLGPLQDDSRPQQTTLGEVEI